MSTSSRIANKKPGRRNLLLLAFGLILLAAVGGSGFIYWKSRSTPAAAASSTLQTATVTRGNIKLFASGTGTLVSPSQAVFGFRASGQVKEVLVQVGDVVEAGQVLAHLDDTTAQNNYQQALRALGELTSPSAIATAKQSVAQDQVDVANYRATLAYLISPDVLYWTEEVARAEDALAKAQAAAAASASAAATAAVQKAQAVLQADKYALAQAQLDYWNDYVPATFLQVSTIGHTVTKKVVPPSDADIAKAWANYDLAKQTLVDDQHYLAAITTGTIPDGSTGSKITALESAQQNVAAAKAAVDDTVLYSPIHGTILSIGFNVGDTAGSGSTVTVANLDQPYTLEIFLDQTDWTNIQVGYPVEITFDLLPGTVYTGKVTSIDPQLSSTNGSLYVHAHVQLDTNVKTALPFGTSASVDVIGGEAANVLLVPLEALHQAAPGEYYVFVMAGGALQLRNVTVGLQDATHAEIKSGLSEGDVVSTGLTATK